MAQITAAAVKQLRDRTGCGMMDCKRALVEADGDLELALEGLRKSGMAKQVKKAGRSATEGKISAIVRDDLAVMVEVLCETDFAARNEKFVEFCQEVTQRVADEYSELGDISEQVQQKENPGLVDLVNNIGENLQVRRVVRLKPQGRMGCYLHLGGKIGVLVDVKGEADDDYLKKLGMQIAAENPQWVRPDDVPAEAVAKEKEIAAAQPDMANKPAQVIDKILEGRIRKWYEQVCLEQQTWLHDGETKVGKVNPQAETLCFLRWQTGEELAD